MERYKNVNDQKILINNDFWGYDLFFMYLDIFLVIDNIFWMVY